MVVSRGDIWWADFGIPIGSEPGYQRPVVVIQDDSFNESRLRTVVVIGMTSNRRSAERPGNIAVPADVSGLPLDSVINVTQITAINKSELVEFVSKLPAGFIRRIEAELLMVLGIDV